MVLKNLILLSFFWLGGIGMLHIHAQTDPNVSDQESVLTEAQQMPRFPGCEDKSDLASKEECANQKLLEFIYTSIRYPEIARETGIQGTVVVEFIIEKDGTLSNIAIAKDIGGGCGEECVRVVELMNKKKKRWTPGTVDDIPVRVLFKQPIKFALQ